MNKHCGCPVIYLGNSICEFVKEVKYLVVMIHSSMKTTIDVARQTRKFYLQANLLRRLLGICKPYSASKMFVSRGIPTFAELLCTSIYRFAQRIEHSSNCIISATLLPLMSISSPIRKLWNCILYVK